jgi:hypothetical protein
MVTRAMKRREHVCQPAGMLLQGSRDNKHEKKDNLFGLDFMATVFYGDMRRFMIHTWIKGIVKRRCDLPGTNAPTGRDIAVQKRTATRLWETLPEFDQN